MSVKYIRNALEIVNYKYSPRCWRNACVIKCSHFFFFFTSKLEIVYRCVMGKTPFPLSFLTSACPRRLLHLCLSPPTPSSLSGGALNSVPDRPAHRGAQLWNGVYAVLSGAPSPRQSTQPTATAEPPEPPGDRPLQSGLCRKAAIDPSPGARAHREKMDRESGETEREARACEGSESCGKRSAGVTLQQQTQNKQKSHINKQ